MVYNIANHDLNLLEGFNDIVSPIYNVDEFVQWQNDISYTQWTLDEISQGLPQTHLGI
jgi:hypothetical protein